MGSIPITRFLPGMESRAGGDLARALEIAIGPDYGDCEREGRGASQSFGNVTDSMLPWLSW